MSNSVTYIFGFSAAVCLTCSIIVSGAAVGLKERQEINKRLDRQKKVLVVAGLIKEGEAVLPEKVKSLFTKRIKQIVVNLKQGTVDLKASQNAASFDQLKATKDPKTSRKAPKNSAGVKRIPNQALVYLVSKVDMSKDGRGFSLSQYIFPVEGKGLWSTLYGFLSLAPDFNTVRGLTFYQHGETPGLGGEIDNVGWKAKWPGRLVFGPKGSTPSSWKGVKLRVIKGTAGSPKKAPYKVDGLSGATLTAKGVTYLVHFWLGSNGFGSFISESFIGKSGLNRMLKGKVIPSKAPVKRRAKAQPSVRRAPASRPVVKVMPNKRPVQTAPTSTSKKSVKAAPKQRAGGTK